MSQISANAWPVEKILNKKYKIDPYQREYKWTTRNINELLDDLTGRFFEFYDESHTREDGRRYGHYFLGSLVISNIDGENFIVDGQQRLISLTLLLIYLNHLQKEIHESERVPLGNFIISQSYGKRTPNINIEDRVDYIRALYKGDKIEAKGESAQNILDRYYDIEQNFSPDITDDVLLFFIDWLLNKVQFVQITTYSSEDAYSIFETINDRGLSLKPTDMLKGYLLTKISNEDERKRANEIWKKSILSLIEIDNDEYPYFFKSWLRAKYANTMRERKRGASNRDFEHIGTSFHKWVRDNRNDIGLLKSADFKNFIEKKMVFYIEKYIKTRKAVESLNPSFQHIYYNDLNNFTLQYPLMLSPLMIKDSPDIVSKKMRAVSKFLDVYIAHRGMNRKKWGYSTVLYSMFNLMKKIRNLDVEDLVSVLKKEIDSINYKFDNFHNFRMHQQNRRFVHYFLSRVAYYIERKCDGAQGFSTYYYGSKKDPMEIEHIIPNKWENYQEDFQDKEDFERIRNLVGGLLLLPKSFNQSYGAKPYTFKVKHYVKQNRLAQSLNEKYYDANPKFRRFISRAQLPFKPYQNFSKSQLLERHQLYRKIAERIWSPKILDEELEGL